MISTPVRLNLLWATSIIGIVICYIVFAKLVFLSQPIRYFSLIDDGQAYDNAHILKECVLTLECDGAVPILVEKEFGRFRPMYWILQSLQFQIANFDAAAIHVVRVLFIGSLLVLLLVLNIYSITKSVLGALFGTMFFISTYSFAENIIRLGPSDSFQLIFIATFSLLFLHFSKLKKFLSSKVLMTFMILCLIAASLIRETSIALLPVILGTGIFFGTPDFKMKKLPFILTPFLLIVLGKYVARPESNTLNYGGFYSTSVSNILATTEAYISILLPLTKYLLPLVTLVFLGIILDKLKSKFSSRALFYWIITGLCFVAIFLPWQFALERYLLICLFAVAVSVGGVVGIAINEIKLFLQNTSHQYKQYFSAGITVLAVILLSNFYFMTFGLQIAKSLNYAHWYRNYVRYEHDLVTAIAETDESLYLNAVNTLDNWEVLYELPLHLRFYFNQERTLEITETLEPNMLVLSTSSLLPVPELSAEIASSSTVVRTNTFEIQQINVLAFRSKLRVHPLQTIMNPDFETQTINHTWSITHSKP
ncbi:MAG: hypothetical protein M3Q81_04120 [bacterium]|nr:hypothetical protein [bacterium]